MSEHFDLSRRQFLAQASGAAVSALLSTGTVLANQGRKPNIVIIVADDLGWNAVGYHNKNIATPNIDDRIVRPGLELDHFYVCPMCSPTRAGLMTGRYPIRYGCGRSVIPPQRDYGVPTDEVMLPAALAKCGYENRGAFGKWHLGHLRKRWLPLSRGFTEFYGCYNGAIDYFTHERDGELDWHHNWDASHDQGYSTDLIAEKAAAFIRRCADQAAPFLCYVPFNAPHAPFQVPPRYETRYSKFQNKALRTYYAMITAMDDGIGKILDALDEKKIADNTLVWFFSDNGGVAQFRPNNLPLKGAKLTTYEGGVRTLAAVRYPAAYRTKAKITTPTAYIDILPTLLSLAGTTPAQSGCKALDGVDLNPLLSGRTQAAPERDLYFYTGQDGPAKEMLSVISATWKLVIAGPDIRKGVTGANQLFLYDIRQDPNETQDIAATHREIVHNLTQKLITFRHLQPANAIAPFNEKVEGFVPPKEWKIDAP